MPSNPEGRSIIERCPLEATVVQKEATGLDQIHLDAETGGKAKQRPSILRYVRLVQGDAQTTSKEFAIMRTTA